MEQIEIDEEMQKAVQNKAQALKRNETFRDLEKEDIEQELYLELCARMGKYKPELSAKATYVHMVLGGKAAKLIRKYGGTSETAWRNVKSLGVVVGYSEDATAETVGDLQENPGARDELTNRNFILDRETMVRSLPERLQPVLRMLVEEGLTQSEAAGRMGLVLTTFRDRFLYPLREEVAKRGGFLSTFTAECPPVRNRSGRPGDNNG